MKIIGIGKNYINTKDEIPKYKTGRQIIFSKPTTSLVIGNADVEFPTCTEDLVYEVELVAKIGKTGKNILEVDAVSYISAFALGIDFTARDILQAYRETKHPWDLAKGFDGAAPISEFKSIENFSDLSNINFNLKINGEERQMGTTDKMIYSFAEIIAYVSKFMTLEAGDLIFTGTPASGVGQTFKGDHFQASLEGELLLDFKML